MSFWPERQAPGQGIVCRTHVVIGCLSRERVFDAPDLDIAERKAPPAVMSHAQPTRAVTEQGFLAPRGGVERECQGVEEV